MPGSPASYVERAVGGRRTPICLPPARGAGVIDFGRVFLSLGADSWVGRVDFSIVKFDGTNKPGFPQDIAVPRGRQVVYELEGGSNPDALAVVDLRGFRPDIEVSVLVETDSP